MAYVLSSISGNLISAASAGFAPTNSADVSAIASSYAKSAASGKLDSSAVRTEEWMMVPTVTSISGCQISAATAAAATMAESAFAWYDASSKQDASAMSAYQLTADMSGYYTTANESGYVDSAYVESAVSGKQDTLIFDWDADSAISSINGSALAGGDVTGDYLTAVVGSDRARIATAFQDGNNNRPSLLISAEREAARSTWPRMILTDWNRTTGLNHSGVLLADGFEFYQCPDSAYGQVSPSGIKRARLDPTNLQFLVNTAISSDEHSANYGRGGLWFFPTGGSALSISISSDTSVGPFIQLNDNSGLSGKMMVSSIGYWNNKLDSSASSSFYTTANESGYIGSAYVESSISAYQPLSGMSSYESSFSAGDGLEFVQSGDDRVLQVEAPVDIVAGPGIVIDNPDGNTLRVSTDENYETVLWSGEALTGITLSESLTNFEQIKVVYSEGAGSTRIGYFVTNHFDDTHLAGVGSGYYWEDTSDYPMHLHGINLSISSNAVTVVTALAQCFSITNNAFVKWDIGADFRLLKVVGIHRIQGGN